MKLYCLFQLKRKNDRFHIPLQLILSNAIHLLPFQFECWIGKEGPLGELNLSNLFSHGKKSKQYVIQFLMLKAGIKF